MLKLRRPHRHRLVAAATGALLALGLVAAAPASAAPRTAAPTPLVVNARWGGHCTFDRVVVDLQGHVPEVVVDRVPELVYDGSGKPVPLPGTHFLEVRLHPAAAHDEAGQSVYRGPQLIQLNLPRLKGLALTGDYEGYVTFGAAFTTRPEYTTFTLHDPERLVLDISHPNVC
ncbi:AMIN-like domain-containing (lipo)protein [Streptomyces antimicrobicus]|uniref:AMIN-like domain-containing protein n=1 Tax=Streptomyces antimicrobicus TaxID=2883108 RepID=A0ABS8BA60_9ACTN|nr:hypothetical protein [Streptomyces antimicrobicus]MCB5181484.1 hypothetical protein [Streptomyces antimicrobicus]